MDDLRRRDLALQQADLTESSDLLQIRVPALLPGVAFIKLFGPGFHAVFAVVFLAGAFLAGSFLAGAFFAGVAFVVATVIPSVFFF